MGWRSVAEERFHPLCLALEVQKKRGRSHFFGMRDAQDFAMIEKDIARQVQELVLGQEQEQVLCQDC